MRKVLLPLSIFVLLVITLSVFFHVPYATTILGLLGWATLGHLVTLDEDMPGEWGNPDGSERVWLHSRVALMLKLVLFTSCLVAVMACPGLLEFGA